jgi:hypothetical protein
MIVTDEPIDVETDDLLTCQPNCDATTVETTIVKSWNRPTGAPSLPVEIMVELSDQISGTCAGVALLQRAQE